MLKNILKKRIKCSPVSSCLTGVFKKALVAGVVLMIVFSSLLPIPAYAADSNKVEISIKIQREVLVSPDLYEHLTLTLKAGKNKDGSDAAVVLREKMNLLGPDRIPLVQINIGDILYIFFDITLDGAETPNAYQGSKVANSYVFYSRSEKELTVFEILSKEGNVFDEMKNLNPGDKFTGVVCLDPGALVKETTTGSQTTTKGGSLPNTNDTSPILLLTSLSITFTVLLAIQLIILKKFKDKEKTSKAKDKHSE